MTESLPISLDVIEAAKKEASNALREQINRIASEKNGVLGDLAERILDVQRLVHTMQEEFDACDTPEGIIATYNRVSARLPSDQKHRNRLEARLPKRYLEVFMNALAEANQKVRSAWKNHNGAEFYHFR